MVSIFDEATPSIRRNSVARLGANGSRVVAGFATATVSARVLGPADKGTLSTLLYVITLLSFASTLGLGDAAVVLAGKDRFPLHVAMSASLVPVAVASVLGASGVWLAAAVADWSNIGPAVVAGSGAVVLAAFAHLLLTFETSRERLVFTSVVSVIEIGVGLVTLVVFMVVFDMGILGGVLAAAAGSLVSVTLFTKSLASAGLSIKPVFDRSYLAGALRMGVVLEATYLLMVLAQRLDLLLVYTLRNEAGAGLYSIALTVGQISAYAAGSLIAATFPRLANTPDSEAAELTQKSSRFCLAAALVSACVLALVIPWLIPFAFGGAFAGAVGPTLILLLGGVVWSEQWLLARAAAATGRSVIAFSSLGVTVASMLLFDVLLIPALGLQGAALGSVLANVCGLSVGLYWYRSRMKKPLSGLLPRASDFIELGRFALRLVARLRVLLFKK